MLTLMFSLSFTKSLSMPEKDATGYLLLLKFIYCPFLTNKRQPKTQFSHPRSALKYNSRHEGSV